MNGGLKILLLRMDTHPEEFENEGKWLTTYNNYKKYMTDKDKETVWNRLCELKMDEFEKRIVTKLMRDEPEQGELTLEPSRPPMPLYQKAKQQTLFGRLFNYT